jgi:integrase
MTQEFNPYQFKKDVVYVQVPNQHGICTIWDWSKQKSKYIKRSEGTQYYAYKRVNGIQKAKCFTNLKEARYWRESILLQVEEAPSELTFKEVKQKYFERIKTKVQITTYEGYESNAKHLWYFDSIPMNLISAKTIDDWLTEIKKPGYLKTQHSNRIVYESELSLLGYILRFYSEYCDDSYQVPLKKRHREDSIVDHEKYNLAKRNNQNKYILREIALKFLDQMKIYQDERGRSRPDWIFYDTVAEFQFGSGTRIGEACAIRFEDVLDWNAGAVLISRSVQWSRKKGRATRISPLTKNGEQRMIYLSERALQSLKRWKLQSGRSTGLVFSFDGINPVGYTSIQKRYDTAFKKLGVSGGARIFSGIALRLTFWRRRKTSLPCRASSVISLQSRLITMRRSRKPPFKLG